MKNLKRIFSDRSGLLDILAVFFGIGSWIGINSLWVQLPLLVNILPEFWNLASYMVIIIQLGNLGPLTYTLMQKFYSLPDNLLIYIIMLLGVLAGGFIPFFYGTTAYFFGAERSLLFFIFTFFFSLTGCTSSVLFMPYFGRFRDIYLITYLIGEGLSGLVPGILGLVQGVSGNPECILVNDEIVAHYNQPRYSTQTFFIIIFCFLIASLLAFLLLDRLKSVRKEYVNVTIQNGNNYKYTENEGKEGSQRLSKVTYQSLLVLIGILCMLINSFLPSIMPFSTLPYGNFTYHFALIFSLMANPVACFIAMFVKRSSVREVLVLSLVLLPFLAYAILTAVLQSILLNNVLGEFLVITCWTLSYGLISYIRMKITTMFRMEGGKSLVWIGVWTQIGSFLGSILSFSLTNFTNIFVSYQPC